MAKIKVCYLTFGLEYGDGANSTSEFVRLANIDARLDVDTISTRNFVDFSFSRLYKDVQSIRRSDLIHYVPRVHHFIYNPIIFLIAIFSKKIVLDLRSVNIQSGLQFYLQCIFIAILARFSKHICGNLGAPRSYGLSCEYTNIPIGVDTNYTSDDLNTIDLPRYDRGCINLLYIGSINKTRHLDRLFADFQQYGDHEWLKLHVIGDAPLEFKVNYPNINFIGRCEKKYITQLLKTHEFVTICFMSKKNHDLAPAIKLLEYSYFNQNILVSRTPGLLAQAQEIGLQGHVFVDHFDSEFWAKDFKKLSLKRVEYTHIPLYSEIFRDLVVPMYQRLV